MSGCWWPKEMVDGSGLRWGEALGFGSLGTVKT